MRVCFAWPASGWDSNTKRSDLLIGSDKRVWGPWRVSAGLAIKVLGVLQMWYLYIFIKAARVLKYWGEWDLLFWMFWDFLVLISGLGRLRSAVGRGRVERDGYTTEREQERNKIGMERAEIWGGGPVLLNQQCLGLMGADWGSENDKENGFRGSKDIRRPALREKTPKGTPTSEVEKLETERRKQKTGSTGGAVGWQRA
ncbi:hypothetical protein P154DRAFT_35868 [Amniculicola lignicola CBS 123094]|uniref:Uncharacterized protein n=1 Tax=Amniculicola lignicola CBS 123094 TaxID=1392246 RepID=A0A6A5WS10_9PLEO|nr:hypothetical protein P154DRAFT_35868 [Amniculicola lignicola CBS 123094]